MNITINFLLVDDIEYSRELLRTALLTCMREHKIDIRSNFFHSSTGKLIVEQITENKIDVVYLDIELSNISGLSY